MKCTFIFTIKATQRCSFFSSLWLFFSSKVLMFAACDFDCERSLQFWHTENFSAFISIANDDVCTRNFVHFFFICCSFSSFRAPFDRNWKREKCQSWSILLGKVQEKKNQKFSEKKRNMCCSVSLGSSIWHRLSFNLSSQDDVSRSFSLAVSTSAHVQIYAKAKLYINYPCVP